MISSSLSTCLSTVSSFYALVFSLNRENFQTIRYIHLKFIVWIWTVVSTCLWTLSQSRCKAFSSSRNIPLRPFMANSSWTTALLISLTIDFTFNTYFRERNGNPFQCSCLENPMDRGAWWATVHGVPKCWTWLKWLGNTSLFIFGCAGSSRVHGLFSSCGQRGPLSSCGTRASHCCGSSCWGAQAPGCVGFSSCASWTLEHRLSSCGTRAWLLCGLWDRPTSEIKPVSPSLASVVVITEPPGKSYHYRL